MYRIHRIVTTLTVCVCLFTGLFATTTPASAQNKTSQQNASTVRTRSKARVTKAVSRPRNAKLMASCCQPKAACCYPGSPCCQSSAGCCQPGAACCQPEAACCK